MSGACQVMWLNGAASTTLNALVVELKSHLPIGRQTRLIGATWMDKQLIGGGKGLAERQSQRVILTRNLLATLRGRELAPTSKDIATETGFEHRPAADKQRATGIYRRRHACQRTLRHAGRRHGVQSGAVEAGDRAAIGAAEPRR